MYFPEHCYQRSRDRTTGKVTGSLSVCGSYPSRDKTLAFPNHQTGFETNPVSIAMDMGLLYLGLKRLGHEGATSPLFRVEAKNAWSPASALLHFPRPGFQLST